MELTKSQLNYIMAIKQLIGGEVSQKYICEYLGVKKPTASIALRNLEDNGYIEKKERAGVNEYFLTEKSYKIIDNIEKEKFEFMSLFNVLLGIDFDVCEEEYKRVCGDFSDNFIDKISNARKRKYCQDAINKDDFNRFYGIAPGIYEIPFRVVQSVESMPSMGNRGFVHPARLVLGDDRQEIMLESRQIYYKSKDEQMLKGKLSRLYYSDSNMNWILSEEIEENVWVIPVKRIICQKDNFNKLCIGIIKIKAVATTKKMPESVAEITFNFKMIKKFQKKNSEDN